MAILDEIVANKRREVSSSKELYPIKLLEKSLYFNTETVSLRHYLSREDKVGIIAEIKRRSPSRGLLNANISVEALSIGYMQAGASALSVLTDSIYFGGSNQDLTTARKFNFCPILRKDFIIDEYQIVEARSIGADVILLIARVLSKDEVDRYAKFAKSLGLEVLLEVHNEEELKQAISDDIDLVGVNNRDLDDLSIDIERSVMLSSLVPPGVVKISESGLKTPDDITRLKSYGYKGFLMGEAFMQHTHPDRECAKFIESLS